MKNYDNLFLMHYGVKGMKWRYHKNNGSNSLYERRRSQIRYSNSASGRPDGDDESARKNPTQNPRYPVDSNGNPENTRKRLIEEQLNRNKAKVYVAKSKAVMERNIKNLGGKQRKDEPKDSILPKKEETFFGKPGRDLKRKRAEYDNGGPNSNPENTRKKLIEEQINRDKAKVYVAKSKAVMERNIKNLGGKQRKEPQPIDFIKPKESGFEEASKKPRRDFKRKMAEYDSRKPKKKRSEYGKKY